MVSEFILQPCNSFPLICSFCLSKYFTVMTLQCNECRGGLSSLSESWFTWNPFITHGYKTQEQSLLSVSWSYNCPRRGQMTVLVNKSMLYFYYLWIRAIKAVFTWKWPGKTLNQTYCTLIKLNQLLFFSVSDQKLKDVNTNKTTYSHFPSLWSHAEKTERVVVRQCEERWNEIFFVYFFSIRSHNLSLWYRFNERVDFERAHIGFCLRESVCRCAFCAYSTHLCVQTLLCAQVHYWRVWMAFFLFICFCIAATRKLWKIMCQRFVRCNFLKTIVLKCT